MASVQCIKPTNETCQQKCQEKPSGQDTAKACLGQTHATHTNGHHHRRHQDQATNGIACQRKAEKSGEHKKKERRNLLQKIKDHISGNSSCSDSSSESDSDNDTCGKRKN